MRSLACDSLHFPAIQPHPASNSPPLTIPTPTIQSAVKPGRADRRSQENPRRRRPGVRPRVPLASRPRDIVKRAGHGRESILWLIRTSRERREVTAKGNRRAQWMVDSDTFLRPSAACFLHPRRVAYVRRPPRDDRNLQSPQPRCVQPKHVHRTQTCYPVLKQICSHLEALAGSLHFPRKKHTE